MGCPGAAVRHGPEGVNLAHSRSPAELTVLACKGLPLPGTAITAMVLPGAWIAGGYNWFR
jgi:hypothetical protein